MPLQRYQHFECQYYPTHVHNSSKCYTAENFIKLMDQNANPLQVIESKHGKLWCVICQGSQSLKKNKQKCMTIKF